MKQIKISISTQPYATTKWHSATLTFVQERPDSEEIEEEYEVSIAVADSDNMDSQILEITFADGLPKGTNEEEIKKLVVQEFNKTDN